VAGSVPAHPAIRAIIFDLDEVLIDARRAWQYAVEEAVAGVCGQRLSAAGLIDEYRRRPWSHAFGVLVGNPAQQDRCTEVATGIFYRSGMKRLLVHEGVGMGLDRVRAGRIEIGAISREPHPVALKQVQSTGLDRFLSVLSATPEGSAWDAEARFDDCLSFLGYAGAQCAFVSAEPADLRALSSRATCYEPRWLRNSGGYPLIQTPGEIFRTVAAVP
jgi:beta-phosphoglucomutase-like phosphatase (HAD superfamily)